MKRLMFLMLAVTTASPALAEKVYSRTGWVAVAGDRVVFSDAWDDLHGIGLSEIPFSVPLDPSQAKQFVSYTEEATQFDTGHKGQTAYISYSEGSADIWVYDHDSGQKFNLSNSPDFDEHVPSVGSSSMVVAGLTKNYKYIDWGVGFGPASVWGYWDLAHSIGAVEHVAARVDSGLVTWEYSSPYYSWSEIGFYDLLCDRSSLTPDCLDGTFKSTEGVRRRAPDIVNDSRVYYEEGTIDPYSVRIFYRDTEDKDFLDGPGKKLVPDELEVCDSFIQPRTNGAWTIFAGLGDGCEHLPLFLWDQMNEKLIEIDSLHHPDSSYMSIDRDLHSKQLRYDISGKHIVYSVYDKDDRRFEIRSFLYEG